MSDQTVHNKRTAEILEKSLQRMCSLAERDFMDGADIGTPLGSEEGPHLLFCLISAIPKRAHFLLVQWHSNI
jgi:hypothetical protein